MSSKEIKLQHRKYFGADKKTQYIQHRINVPDGLIQKMGWDDKESLIIYVESRKGKKRIVLKTKTNQTDVEDEKKTQGKTMI